jgi:hypothetical protein
VRANHYRLAQSDTGAAPGGAANAQHIRKTERANHSPGAGVTGAFVYGVVQLYLKVAAAYGAIAGTAAVVALLAALTALAVRWLQRYRAIHGKRVNGERVLMLTGDWGSLRLDAERKNGVLEMNGRRVVLIFADIGEARAVAADGKWHIALTLHHHTPADWKIPVADGSTANRWSKIFTLAAAQKL